MNLPDEAPKLNPWPFIAGDAVLLGTAYLVGSQHPAPLSGIPLVIVAVLVFTGALLAVIPFLLNYVRRQEVALAERQREIAALAQTTSASAEQLSIAVASLHTLTDAATKAAKQADQLPLRLQEKIHEFKEQLNEVSVTENEALSQEVNTLRAAETERMENVLTTVRKLSSEFARLEAASRKNVTELSETLGKFTTSAEQAAAEATTAIAALRAGGEKSLAAAQSAGVSAIKETLDEALTEMESKLSTLTGQLTAKVEHVATVLEGRIAALQRLSTENGPAPRPLRVRHEKPDAPEPTPSPAVARSAEPPPSTAENPAVESEPPEEPKPARRRAQKPVPADHEMTLGLELPPEPKSDDFSQEAPDEADSASAVSADGLTRLLVTAYIGIGNRLFIRGEGPGLSWDKGAPLQFVSIGKWRWETGDATGPIRAKLYKNDEIECAALGELTLEAGHQKDVRANFN